MARNLSDIMRASPDKTVGDLMAQARRLFSLSQWRDVSGADIAALVGVKYETYWRYENNKRLPPRPTRIALAQALGVDKDYFEVGLAASARAALLADEESPAKPAAKPRSLGRKRVVPRPPGERKA